MTKHILQYEIGRTHEDSFYVIATLTTAPKSDIIFNKLINSLDRFLNYDYLNHDDFDVVISLDDMQVPCEYHNASITIEALSTILSVEQEGGKDKK